jgi:multiple sugar transport system substrate-binding protein
MHGRGARARGARALTGATRAATCACALLLACRGGPSPPGTLTWYVNPDNGAQARLAERCSAASGGRYRIEVHDLPRDATGQREQLVRRLAAQDASIDLVNVDPPFLPELANAGFLRPFTPAEAGPITAGVLAAPLRAATWRGQVFAIPLWANAQLLWYRRSVARRAGLDPDGAPVTWAQLVGAAERTGTTVEVQARRYEGYMVWIGALVASAGGAVLRDPEAGRDARPGLASPAGRAAADVIRRLATSTAADPALATADEEVARAGFQGARGGFMVNWPYVYGAAREAVAAGALPAAVLEDIGWARYPRVDPALPSRPPLGGIGLAVSAFGRRAALAVEAARCLSSEESQRGYMLDANVPVARAAAYDDPAIRARYPMADLIRASIDEAEPRPRTPYYVDVSTATVRTFHPPADVDPARTPAEAERLIVAVLHDRALL